MVTEYHIPVLLNTAVSFLINPVIRDHVIVDGTLGGGSYTRLICESISDKSKIIAIDKDENAIAHTTNNLGEYRDKILFAKGNFADVKRIVSDVGYASITGIVLDLGLSSYQLNEEDGFSFMKNTPLDMRADKSAALDARTILNEYRESELTEIFEEYGEVSRASRLSKAVADARRKQSIETTEDFIKIIKREYGFKATMPVKFLSKLFQALRIAVNDELNDLKTVLSGTMEILIEGGRIVVVSYHSLEDRIVKNFFREHSEKTVQGGKALKILTKKVIVPEYSEVRMNSRSRSAKLRAAEAVVV
ncbi:MAG: 16S rRNA (cytosine(1402)-N(4))-methyltransferase RsmH [Bacteroidetes bacterium]|nr:16S rRNA (cytosine(1402)-N(4))-methyltransferase RsmH [Bacteroidota bacterium]